MRNNRNARSQRVTLYSAPGLTATIGISEKLQQNSAKPKQVRRAAQSPQKPAARRAGTNTRRYNRRGARERGATGGRKCL